MLDVSKADGVVDLSLAPALLPATPNGGGKGSKEKEPRADKWKVQTAATLLNTADDNLVLPWAPGDCVVPGQRGVSPALEQKCVSVPPMKGPSQHFVPDKHPENGSCVRLECKQVSSEKVDVTVQLVKPDYLVVSLPRRKPSNPPTLGFLSTKVRQHCSTTLLNPT